MRPRKFFFLSHSFHNSTIFEYPSSTFSLDISLFDTQFLHLSISPIAIDFKRCNQFLLIDSCCYGSDYVLPRNSCQLHFLVLTTFLHVSPVSHISWFWPCFFAYFLSVHFSFQPPLSEFVLAFSSSSVPTADVRYVLAFLECYPVIPASKNSFVLAAWINFKVGTPI